MPASRNTHTRSISHSTFPCSPINSPSGLLHTNPYGTIAASDIRAGELALYQKATTFFMRGEHLLVKKRLEEAGESPPLLPKQSTGDKRKYANAKKQAAEGLLAMSTRTGGVDLAKNMKVEASLEMADVGAALPADEDIDTVEEQMAVTTQPFNFNNLADRTR